MKTNLKSLPLFASAVLAGLALTACSTNAPFFLSNASEGGSANAGGEAPTVQIITEKLIKEQKSQRELQVGQELDNLVGTPRPYTIGAGDIILVVIWGHPELVAGAS